MIEIRAGLSYLVGRLIVVIFVVVFREADVSRFSESSHANAVLGQQTHAKTYLISRIQLHYSYNQSTIRLLYLAPRSHDELLPSTFWRWLEAFANPVYSDIQSETELMQSSSLKIITGRVEPSDDIPRVTANNSHFNH